MVRRQACVVPLKPAGHVVVFFPRIPSHVARPAAKVEHFSTLGNPLEKELDPWLMLWRAWTGQVHAVNKRDLYIHWNKIHYASVWREHARKSAGMFGHRVNIQARVVGFELSIGGNLLQERFRMQGVLFVQKRASQAGAQSALARLFAEQCIQRLQPVLLCGERGWLPRKAESLGINEIITPFPSSRSLAARLFKNREFSEKVAALVHAEMTPPSLVIANDHAENLLALELGRQFGTRTMTVLRSSGMSKEVYFKYGCDRADSVATIGQVLCARVRKWDCMRSSVACLHDGIAAREFVAPRPSALEFPSRVLVIGSAASAKGWEDFAEAVRLIAGSGGVRMVDFSGDPPASPLNLGADIEVRFLGRQENLSVLARNYELVINPSRNESFGLAALEILAAGVPLLSTKTGVLGKVLPHENWLVPPQNPVAMASVLIKLKTQWRELSLNVAKCQNHIREHFLMENMARQWARHIQSVIDDGS